MSGDIDMNGNSIINERLVEVATGISTTTAALGFADVYRATAPSITITVSSADIAEEGRVFIFTTDAAVTNQTPVVIDTEGAETIDGAASVSIVAIYGVVRLRAIGGNLEGV